MQAIFEVIKAAFGHHYGALAVWAWCVWAVLLVVQNISFTYVSRARSSGSIMRHFKASIFSNGVWFIGQMMIFSTFMKVLTGQFGWGQAVGAAAFYTTFCVAGSLLAHWWSLKTEKGKDAVGANKRYAQVPIEEWNRVKAALGI